MKSSSIVSLLLIFSASNCLGSESIFRTHILGTAPSTIPRSVSLGDLDGDGDLDLMTADSNANQFRWFENNGATAPSFTPHVAGAGRLTPTNVFSADINGDSYMDIVSVSVIDDMISYYANDGQSDPSFTNVVINQDPNPFDSNDEGYTDDPRMAAAGDLDGDGDLDIAVSSVGDDKIAWYENEGTTWTPHTLTDSLDGSRAVWVADLDGDDDMDVIGGPWFSNTLYWYENDGNAEPSFTERVMATFPHNPTPLASLPGDYDIDPNGPLEDGLMWRMMTEDMDNDGDIDVIAARRNQGVVEWYENDGGAIPQWTRHTILDEYIAGKSIFPMDVNMDGHMDMVFAARGNSQISWYENMGDADSFVEHILYEGTEDLAFGARSVFGGDMDGDGDPDFAWVALSSGIVAWEENLTIQLHADFDRDGDVDSNDLSDWEDSAGIDAGGDADGDGDSDGYDFLIWQRQFTGDLSSSITSAAESVPEPSSALIAAALLIFSNVSRNTCRC